MYFDKQASSFQTSMNQLGTFITAIIGKLLPEEQRRLKSIEERWNMYEGFQWQGIPEEDKPQVTKNYCRRFADKLNYFLFGKDFVITVPSEMENLTLPFLNNVWDAEHNNRSLLCLYMGQSGGVTGDAYVGVSFNPLGQFTDPFSEYPKGRIDITVYPPQICFPRYNTENRNVMDSFNLIYPVEVDDSEPSFYHNQHRPLFSWGSRAKKKVSIKTVSWTNDFCRVFLDDELIDELPNKLGIIPFAHIRNMPILTSDFGVSDIEDIIPINKELNFRSSDIAEVIDYHGAPITVVFGASIRNLERGANKIWGGLPVNAKVENLSLDGDLSASIEYYSLLKKAMHEIGGIPETSLGAERAVSNTSGVAMHIENLPLIEKTHWKIASYGAGIKRVNRLVLLTALIYGLIDLPSKVVGIGGANSSGNDVNNDMQNQLGTANTSVGDTRIDSASNDVTSRGEEVITDRQRIRSMFFDVGTKFYNVLPKDELQEIEKIRSEIEMGIESRVGAMNRLGKNNIQRKLEEIAEDKKKQLEEELKVANAAHPQGEGSSSSPNKKKLPIRVVSGFNNGPEPKPQNKKKQ